MALTQTRVYAAKSLKTFNLHALYLTLQGYEAICLRWTAKSTVDKEQSDCVKKYPPNKFHVPVRLGPY